MSNIFLSVIVPVYGVEHYIERCVRSLFGQTYQDEVEFIFVDDCTPDNSICIIKDMLSEYPHRRPQTQFIHHSENRGLPSARKTGLEVAKGEYVLNIDSDDWIEPDMFNLVIEKAKREYADVVVYDFFYSNGIDDIEIHQPIKTDNGFQFLMDVIRTRNKWAVWNKMFRRSLYFEPSLIEFPVEFMGEDLLQTLQLLDRARKISYVSQSVYHYFINPNSFASQKDLTKIRLWSKMMGNNIEKWINLRGTKNSQDINDWMRMQAKVLLYPVLSKRGGRNEYLRKYPELNYRILLNPIATFRAKLQHFAALIGLYWIFSKFLAIRKCIRKY